MWYQRSVQQTVMGVTKWTMSCARERAPLRVLRRINETSRTAAHIMHNATNNYCTRVTLLQIAASVPEGPRRIEFRIRNGSEKPSGTSGLTTSDHAFYNPAKLLWADPPRQLIPDPITAPNNCSRTLGGGLWVETIMSGHCAIVNFAANNRFTS